ncbi:hypothetical protein EDC01DRAFT_499665 [Geopyxis carbonaria]|nr:hypothetical protein EDC01DRAFT_499665 [Geopyxis carbonaria]
MVLQNKWDRKATRARQRKFKAKGKELPEDKQDVRSGKRQTSDNQGSSDQKDEEGVHSEKDSDDDDQNLSDGQEAGKQDDGGDVDESDEPVVASQFSRRKVQSNSWRYEADEEPQFPLSNAVADSSEIPEPEPDYVALSLNRKGELKDTNEAQATLLDHAFLQQSKLGTKYAPETYAKKSNIIKVNKQDFEEVTEKIKKQSYADAFRLRFAQKNPRTSRLPRSPVEDDQVVDDVDAFLGELSLTATHRF